MNADPQKIPGEEKAQRVAWLIAGFLRGTLTETEHDELDEWITASDENQQLFEKLTDPDYVDKGLATFNEQGNERALEKIKKDLHFNKPARRSFSNAWLYRIAAAIIILLAIYIVYDKVSKKSNDEVAGTEVIQPGGNYATLTVNDGKTIILQNVGEGVIDSTNGNKIKKTSSAELSYLESSDKRSTHTLATPKGGQYRIVLQDGTKVWLNSSSTLKYPVVFSGEIRDVELEGEGYFEVASDAKRPFIVKTKLQEIKVVGTHFNVNAYPDDSITTTTLVEGKIVVTLGRSGEGTPAIAMDAGQQIKISPIGSEGLEDINTEVAIAWTNGVFKFRNEQIDEIMKQVSRWYNAEIVYEGKPDYHFNATINRNESVTKLLNLLEETGRVHFEIKGKKIIVRN